MLTKFFITHIFTEFVLCNILCYNHGHGCVDIACEVTTRLCTTLRLFYIRKSSFRKISSELCFFEKEKYHRWLLRRLRKQKNNITYALPLRHFTDWHNIFLNIYNKK